MPQSRWSRADDVELAQRYTAGDAIADIAVALSRTESMITTRASTLGLRRRRLKDQAADRGNALWLIGAAIQASIPLEAQAFAEDLLNKLP